MPFVPDNGASVGHFVPDGDDARAVSKEAPTENTEAGFRLGPWVSAAVRPVAEGVAALPLMAMNAGVAGRNLLTGSHYELPGAMFQSALDRYTSKPQGIIGKGSEFISSSLLGGLINPTGIGFKALDEVPQALAGTERAAVMREAHQAGYSIPASEIEGHAGTVGRTLESVAGKAQLERDVARDNQRVTNRLAKLALGLHPDHPAITPETLDVLREEAAKPYESLAALGKIRADEPFMSDLAEAGSQFSKLDRAFPTEPGIAPDQTGGVDASKIEALKGRYFQPSFTGREAIDAMRTLRKEASKNLSQYDPQKNALGMVQRQIADAFEARLERQAERAGDAGLVDRLRQARVKIAQTYAIEAALNKATGNVSAPALAKAWKAGAPLSGELQTIARAASAFPKVTRETDKLGRDGPFSVVDFLAAAGGWLHDPSLALAAATRPAVRAYLRRRAQALPAAPGAPAQSFKGAIPGMLAPAMEQSSDGSPTLQ